MFGFRIFSKKKFVHANTRRSNGNCFMMLSDIIVEEKNCYDENIEGKST